MKRKKCPKTERLLSLIWKRQVRLASQNEKEESLKLIEIYRTKLRQYAEGRDSRQYASI